MCWRSKQRKVKMADTDIPVFKIARESDCGIHPYFSNSSPWRYVEGETYANDKSFDFNWKTNGTFEVNEAIHSYSAKNIRLTTDDVPPPYIRVCTYKTTKESNDVFTRYSQCYSIIKSVVMLCTIPKGTRYAVNEVGEIVSNAIKVEKMIKNPFTTNKDHTVSRRSIGRVNKILNDWEKENYD